MKLEKCRPLVLLELLLELLLLFLLLALATKSC